MKKNIIKSKMSKKAIAAVMAMMIMTTPVTSASFADEVPLGEATQTTTEQEAESTSTNYAAPTATPDRPDASSHKDNSKIEEYNKKVDEYNESARQYNESVDKEYATAVEEANKTNEQIDQHNAAEKKRVKDAEERNAQVKKAVDEENQQIDQYNAAEKDRIDKFNREEAAKEKVSQEARAAAEAENENIRAHNANVAKYKLDMEQYQADLAQYEYDSRIEAQILNLGYGSVEQYNAAIDKAYNAPAKKSVEKNASAEKVSVKDTYAIQEAAVKSGIKVTVHIEHNFQGIDLSYVEDFEIDANDIIKVNPISAVRESTSPGYATFYYNTDDQHQMGYWMEAYSSVGSNARHSEYGWNCGDTHEISYKDGKNHASDKEEIVVEYNYMWNPLKVYKTYNTPVEPTAPVNPGEARDLVEVPELYVAKYEKFESKQHVKAELEEISEAVILENVADPVKRAYLSLIDHMELFDVPEEAEVPATAAVPAAAKKDAPAEGKTIVDEALPLTVVEEVAENEVPMTIVDNETPQAAAGAWALINLLSALATALLSLIIMALYFRPKHEENEENEETTRRNRKGLLRLVSLIPAIEAIAAFILTENMANPMVLTDRWTILMIVILAIQIGVAILVKGTTTKKETHNA